MEGFPAPAERRIPPGQWQVGPWNRWSYQHVREVVPTALVSRADSGASDLPERPHDLDRVTFRRADGTLHTAGEYVEAAWVDGIAVLHGGALVYERYANGMDAASRHLSQSVGKSVLGLVVGALAADGVLDVDTPVTAHVPELEGSGYAGATVRHLLDMTAAVDFVEDYAGDFWRYDVACGWHPPRAGAEHAAVLDYLRSIGPAPWRHGEAMLYTSPSTDLLGIIAERATGKRLSRLIADRLWSAMGAEHDADLAVDPAGTAIISGGFCATLRDYARVGQIVIDGGRARGSAILGPGWIASLGDGDHAASIGGGPQAAHWREGRAGYRNLWWRLRGRVVARGIHGQLIAADPAAGVVVAILSSWPEATDAAEETAQWAMVVAICEALAGGRG